uniref:Uncharacterized protein n=1 Tax=Cacopsylla melanoneura TaxID=428564 RepID=A0A8D8SKY3_9HEMI
MPDYQIHKVVIVLLKSIVCLLLVTSCSTWPLAEQNNNVEEDNDVFSPGLSLYSREELLNEPSCNQLKIMWRFSMRQSRIAEITNRYPMYRDPFAHNLWDEFDRPLSHGLGYNKHNQHYVYGQIRHTVPNDAPARSEDAPAYGKIRNSPKPHKSQAQNRMVGKPSPPFSPKGQFQVLKEMIKEERKQQNNRQKSRKGQEVKDYRDGKNSIIAQTPTKLYQTPRSRSSNTEARSKSFYSRDRRDYAYDDEAYYDIDV